MIYVIVFSMMHYGVNCTYNLSMNFSHIWQILDLISFVSCVKVLLSCVICLAASFYRLEKLFLSELSIRTVETSEVTCTMRNSLCVFEPPRFISHLVIGDLLDSNLRFISSIKHVSIAIGTAGHQIVWN